MNKIILELLGRIDKAEVLTIESVLKEYLGREVTDDDRSRLERIDASYWQSEKWYLKYNGDGLGYVNRKMTQEGMGFKIETFFTVDLNVPTVVEAPEEEKV